MEERQKRKGTVTPLSSVLPAEEARKAAKRVEEAITQKESELNNLHLFDADNSNLINLVKRLPDELHHDIMVPFGKAAFFPGRVIHTYEFLVLLGEGYYADRTSKQTIDILKRRGKALDSQVDALKGMIKDLRLEASFFNSTAAEAEEGLLEIREEYTEADSKENTNRTGLQKPSKPSISRPQNMVSVTGGSEEDARLMARMDELEIEEEKYANTDDKEFAKMMAKMDELEREEEEEEARIKAGMDELEIVEEEEEEEEAAAAADDNDDDDDEDPRRKTGVSNWVSEDQYYNCHEKVADKLKMGSLSLQSSLRGESSSNKDMPHNVKERSTQMDMVAAQMKWGNQTATKSNHKASMETFKPDAGASISRPIADSRKVQFLETQSDADTRIAKPSTDSRKVQFLEAQPDTGTGISKPIPDRRKVQFMEAQPDAGTRVSKPITDSRKAFTGSIIEHSDNLPTNPSQQTPSQASSSLSSKPVSRFKMQRR